MRARWTWEGDAIFEVCGHGGRHHQHSSLELGQALPAKRRRCWPPRRPRPSAGARLERERRYVFSAASPDGVALDSLVLPWVNANTRLAFLAAISRRHAGVADCRVKDQAGWHLAGYAWDCPPQRASNAGWHRKSPRTCGLTLKTGRSVVAMRAMPPGMAVLRAWSEPFLASTRARPQARQSSGANPRRTTAGIHPRGLLSEP